jgi:C-terminal processing protease CtpA/Prc
VLDPRTIERLAKLYGGMPLLGCLPGSPAARAGLRFGDIVVSVNGVATPDVDAFVAAKELRGGAMSVAFVRDGKELLVELEYDGERPPLETAVRHLAPPPPPPPPPDRSRLN